MRNRSLYLFCFLLILTGIACHHKQQEADDQAAEPDSKEEQALTPVTITTVQKGTLSDSLELNATANFIQSNIVKSNINGYIKAVAVKTGQYAAAGQTLFTLQTKEAASLGNTINRLDPSFHFNGLVHIRAAHSGYVAQLLHQQGDYVQDGEQLAVLNDASGFGFIMNVPYEFRPFVALNKSVQVHLPDGSMLNGTIARIMPTIDSVSQTQAVLVKTSASFTIPQNLIAKVYILKTAKANVSFLPRAAILTDEAQTNFWVMKMTDSVTAVKVPVIKGMETQDKVEIVRPVFSPNDKILLSGNYGLPDTAKVKIVKEGA